MNKFPYTNFHDINLDWILKKLSEIMEKIQKFVSIPAGGSTGQSLVKISDSSYDVGWQTINTDTSDIFWAEYGVTSPAEISAAHADGKVCAVNYSTGTYYLTSDDGDDGIYFAAAQGDRRQEWILVLGNPTTWYAPTYATIPTASNSNPKPAGTATPGTQFDYARSDHVHPAQAVPSPYGDIPEDLGPVGFAGSESEYARGDHVHKMPDANDIEYDYNDVDNSKSIASYFNRVSDFTNNAPDSYGKLTNVGGVTTIYDHGEYTVKGTATGDGGRTGQLVTFTLKAGTYTVRLFNVDNHSLTYPAVFIEKVSDNSIILSINVYGTASTINIAADTEVYFGTNVVNGQEYNYYAQIQIESGNSAPDYKYPQGTALDKTSRFELNKLKDYTEELNGFIVPIWNAGYYVNNNTHGLSPFTNFYYSDSIILKAGDSIQVKGAYTNTANVVDLLSKWDSNGNYISSVYAFPATGYVDSPVYYASEETEYIRVCTYNYNNTVLDTIKVIKKEAGAISELIQYTVNPSLSMFERIGFCGDSYVNGQIYKNGVVQGDYQNLSWGANIGRMNGITPDIYASSGANTDNYQTRSTCLPAILASANPAGLYIFCLGINDYTTVTLGTLNDITDYTSYTQYPNTFYGNYGKIIEQLMAYSADSKIIIMTPYHPSYNSYCLTAVEEITDHYGIAMINTKNSKLCMSSYFTTMLDGGHPTAPLYSAMATDITNLVNTCIFKNYDYFKDYKGV